jgi:hypothetical protein
VDVVIRTLNWQVGWWLVLAAFATGAAIGLGFHRPDFLGGYGAFRRRILRLGHIALAALGILNVVFAMSPWPSADMPTAHAASLGFIVGGLSMPAVCFLTAWRESFRHLFFIPVLALMAAVICTLIGGPV